MNQDVAREIGHRDAAGCERVTMDELRRRLRAIGYRLDRSLDCSSIARTISPPERAGESYPTTTGYVVEADTGRSAAHVDGRRDARYQALRAMRLGGVYAVNRGRIYDI